MSELVAVQVHPKRTYYRNDDVMRACVSATESFWRSKQALWGMAAVFAGVPDGFTNCARFSAACEKFEWQQNLMHNSKVNGA